MFDKYGAGNISISVYFEMTSPEPFRACTRDSSQRERKLEASKQSILFVEGLKSSMGIVVCFHPKKQYAATKAGLGVNWLLVKVAPKPPDAADAVTFRYCAGMNC